MRSLVLGFCVLALFCTSASAQLSADFGYSHKTGGGATNGFEAGAEYGLNKYVKAAAEFSPYWGSTAVGTVKSSTKEQDYMFGGRFDIPYAFRNSKIVPFGQLLYGVAHTSINVTNINGPQITSDSSTSWAWDLGGGVEYLFRPKWKLRGKVDLFKTHFADLAQTNAKFNMAIVYCFGQGCRRQK